MAERVPQKTVEANLAALRAGRAVIENGRMATSLTMSEPPSLSWGRLRRASVVAGRAVIENEEGK